MIVRAAVEADLGEMLALEQAVAEAPHWSESQYRAMFAEERYALFVARDEDLLMGFVAVSLVVDEAELESIVVSPLARRKGIGHALLRASLDWATKRGGVVLRLEVRALNAAARAFYVAKGFVEEGIRRNYYTNPTDDAVLMGLPLATRV